MERLSVRNFNIGVSEVSPKQFALILTRAQLRNRSCRKAHLNCKTLGLLFSPPRLLIMKKIIQCDLENIYMGENIVKHFLFYIISHVPSYKNF